MISGARGCQTTGLKRDKNLFSATGDFVLWVVTEEFYLASKGDYSLLRNNPFALIYAYYNYDSDANANLVYTIPAYMGGEAYLIINNPTNYNVELRNNGLFGEPLVFAGSNILQAKIHVSYGDYYTYPVFRKFKKKLGEIVTYFPKVKGTDKSIYFQYSLSENGVKSQEFNVQEFFDPVDFKYCTTPGAAYISIYNGNSKTGVALYKGANSEATITSTGGKYINTGRSLVFEVPMVSTNGTSFTTNANITGWKVGTPVSTMAIPELTMEAGKIYYLDVGGNDAYNVTASWHTQNDEIICETIDYDDD